MLGRATGCCGSMTRRVPPVRAVFAATLVVALLITATPADASQAQLDHAQAQANEAARQLADAQTEQAKLEASMADLRAKIDATSGRLGSVAAAMKDRAVQEYIHGSGGGMVLDPDLAKTTP